MHFYNSLHELAHWFSHIHKQTQMFWNGCSDHPHFIDKKVKERRLICEITQQGNSIA